MNIKEYFKNKKDLKGEKIIKVKNKNIPYDEIKNNNKVTFIVCTKDEKVLTETLSAITEVSEQNKEKEITVIISSSYNKLHELTNGAL